MADSTAEALPDNPLESQESLPTNQSSGGRFQVGNKFGVGRPTHLWGKSTKKFAFRRAMAIQWKIMNGNIVDSYIDKRGKRIVVIDDLEAVQKACKFVAEYAAGKPEQKIDLSIVGDVERPNTLMLVLNRPTTKQERTEASRQIIELASTIDESENK